MKFKWKSFFRNEDTCFERIKIFSGGTKALVWCEDGNLYVWSLLTCRQLTRCEFEAGGKVICSDITANEELLASVSSDQTIVLWRAYGVSDKLPKLNNGLDNRGLEIYRYRLAATPSCCRFESRGHFLAIGDMEGHLHVLDLLKESIMVFEDRLQSDAVQDVLVSPNGATLVTVGDCIRFWDRETRRLLQTFTTRGSSMARVAASARFDLFVTVDDSGVLYVLELVNP